MTAFHIIYHMSILLYNYYYTYTNIRCDYDFDKNEINLLNY